MKPGDLIRFRKTDWLGFVVEILDDEDIRVHVQWNDDDMKHRAAMHVWTRDYLEKAAEIIK